MFYVSWYSFSFSDESVRNKNKDVYVTVSSDKTELNQQTHPEALCNVHFGALNQFYTLITCSPPITGQYVQLQYVESSDSVINLYEIEVHGV